ncbi:MAG: apolipoprotein N-acyltransferase [Myxococcota bacterium]|nr:apolipoprotein N-acyltransferase [Myxococcota bacterium]
MARSAKPSRPARSSDGEPAPVAVSTKKTALPLAVRVRPWLLLALSAVLMFLGFAGFGIWPLAFVGIIPALFVFDPLETRGGFERPAGKWFFWRALFFGYLAELGGFYWLVTTLVDFSGFPLVICLLFGSIFFLFQGLQFVAILALWARARARGFSATPALVAAYLASEAVFPMLFEHYYGSAFHPVPLLMQVADLGGPMMCTALAMIVAGALYDVGSAATRARGTLLSRIPRLWPSIALAYLLFAIGYGAFRLAQVDAMIAEAPHLTVGVVQTNMGLFEKWESPATGVRRHVEQTQQIAERHDPDLVVWPESAVTYFLPGDLQNLRQWPWARRLGLDEVNVPIVFGALRQRRTDDGREVDRNTAFLAGADGTILGTYDKTYLLAFGEFIPFGETFPVLYDISPMSGRFTPGDDPAPVIFPARDGREYRLSILVCYEDIVSAFVREAVGAGDPHLLVNITNDSWFGDTQEPWVHLNLARFRAVEHRRYLIRATNSGVSAIVDAAGRLTEHSGVFVRANLVGEVAMLEGPPTLYGMVGAWPGWLALLSILLMGFLPERFLPRRRHRSALDEPVRDSH